MDKKFYEKEKVDRVAQYCKNYRTYILELSLTDFCNLVGANIKNVSAFENCRANNITYLMYYWKADKDETRRQKFLKGLCEVF